MSKQHLVAALVLCAAMNGQALAASSAVTSASDSLSTSVDSISRSIKKSSDSSVRTVVGQGDYTVIQMAEAEAGSQDVTLQAVPGSGATGEFTLRLPDKAVQQGGLAVGQVVSARERPYGVEFARADPVTRTRTAFFLLLEDEWYRELQSVAVTL
jgi:hypothetical protein